MSRQREAERQGALLGALFAPAEAPRLAERVAADTLPPAPPGNRSRDGHSDAAGDAQGPGGTLWNAHIAERHERLQRGLGAYRGNAAGIAERALAAAYPTLTALVGPQDGAALARALWRASPPLRGDLAQWGGDLPEFIEAQRGLDPWPYLADCARLDATVQRCEAAADAAPEPATLTLLAEQPPEALVLRLLPSVQLLASDWPVATLHVAHRHTQPDGSALDMDALECARVAIGERRGESVVVARAAWRALPHAVDAPTFAWMRSLHANATLAQALVQAGPDFEFNAWLLQAVQQQWLWKAEALPSPGTDLQQHPPIARRST
ncbi:putative DNA-binding domain-containing protein [Methylibium sp.]|uniref:HvfC/BufC family peptide modification chaperone n=1 Tax=Methylibium sp. TaxID=2067992 RepID=UPI0017943D34|nr:putative DNA-binding domain-containing protein [Methylibium sp.]MBA3590054.1 putative DNA-binding domain-containing protein [Methylibium sp.]